MSATTCGSFAGRWERYRAKLVDAEAEADRIRSQSSERIAALTVVAADAEERAREAEARLEAIL